MFSSDGTLISASAAPHCGELTRNSQTHLKLFGIEVLVAVLVAVLVTVLAVFPARHVRRGRLRHHLVLPPIGEHPPGVRLRPSPRHLPPAPPLRFFRFRSPLPPLQLRVQAGHARSLQRAVSGLEPLRHASVRRSDFLQVF